ncbi:Heterokaryon incompatibility protein (HET) domain containing protein [Naviculisporaceae sp. PSN 640]
MAVFDYNNLPLRQDEIRILELLPAAAPDDPIVTQISKADLHDFPSFSALSYCWGDTRSRDPVEIAIGSDTLSITASLAMALRAIRRPDISVRLWIDQICINQHDDEEKSRQIPLMNKIYSLSTETIGWLGESTKDSDLAMDYLHSIGPRAYALGLSSPDEDTLQVLLSDEGDLNSGILSVTPSVLEVRRLVLEIISEQGSLLELPALEGMVELAMLPYFRRGWIQQEVAIPTNLRLQWGAKTIGPDHFTAGVWLHQIWINSSVSSLVTAEIYGDPSSKALAERILSPSARLIDHVVPSLTTRGWYHSQDATLRGKLTMAGLLRRLRTVQFTEPRDRIYGILGLAMDRTPPTFTVDTTKRWEDVFTDATRYIVMHGDSENLNNPSDGINFLSQVSFPKKNSDSLPSWVPDLDAARISTLSRDTGTLSPPYQAGGPRRPTRTEQNDQNPRILTVRGVILDKVIDLGPAWKVDEPEDPNRPPDNTGGLAPLSYMSSLATKSHGIVTSNPHSKHPFRNDPTRLLEAEWRVPVLNRESVASTSASRRATILSKTGYEKAKYLMLFYTVLKLNDPYKILSDIPLSQEEIADLDAKYGPNCETNPNKKKRMVSELQLKGGKATEYMTSKEYKTYAALWTLLSRGGPF